MFAIGDFGFPGLLVDDRVIDLSQRVSSTRELFEDWEASFAWLQTLDGGVPLDGLSPHSLRRSFATEGYKGVLAATEALKSLLDTPPEKRPDLKLKKLRRET